MRLAARDRLVLDADQLERLRAFHSFLVRDVILVFKKEPLMDFDQVGGSCWPDPSTEFYPVSPSLEAVSPS